MLTSTSQQTDIGMDEMIILGYQPLAFACVLCWTAFGLSIARAQPTNTESQTVKSTALVNVHVIDENDHDLAGVEIRGSLWTGNWEKLPGSSTTNQAGMASLENLPSGKYMTVFAQAKGKATMAQDLELESNETRSITIRMKRPLMPTIRVVDDRGKPIKDAVLSVLSFKCEQGGGLFHRFGTKAPWEFEPSASDDTGVIQLPPIPQGANIGLVVFHPDWLMKKIDNLEAVDGLITTVSLERGIPIELKLVPGTPDGSVPELMPTRISMTPFLEYANDAVSIYHLFRPESNTIRFHVSPAKYEFFDPSFRDNKYTITPHYYAYASETQKRMLDISPGAETQRFEFLVRKNVIVKGRIVGDLSLLAESSEAVGATENLHPSLSISEKAIEWRTIAFDKVRSDGTYELELPPGRARISFDGGEGVVSSPTSVEMIVTAEGENIVPDIRLEKLDKLKGHVVDEFGKPAENVMVRIYYGSWGSDYLLTDALGVFELQGDSILKTSQHFQSDGIAMPVSIGVFDLDHGRFGWKQLTDDWVKEISSNSVQLHTSDVHHVLDSIRSQFRSFRTAQSESMQKNLETEIEATRRSLPAGDIGQVPPNLSEGNWLNTTASSLEDLRGKYVLLEFWFIGCGPCEQDMPTVRLAHKLFGERNFTALGVHVTAQTAENVSQYATQHDMHYPIVVDGPKSEIEHAYRKLGVRGFPSYFLIGPDGTIVHNDHMSTDMSLRVYKIEKLLEHVYDRKK